jgi:glycosyltransferase involved in cell wall biosynthesis
MLNRATGIITIGRDMAEVVRQKLRPDRWESMHLIPNWSDETVVKPILPGNNPFRHEHEIGNRMLVQYAGRHGSTHNLEPLVYAAERLSGQPILFQFIGEGAKKKKLQRMVQERALDNVMFLPYQPLDELDTVLSAADLAVVCLESKFTGLSVPSKTYGIMAGGTPILGFLDAESEIGQTIRENECGAVLEDPTGEQVARLLQRLLQEPEQLEAMGRRGRQAFEAKYTLSHAAVRYDQVLQQHIYGIKNQSSAGCEDVYPMYAEEASENL